MKINLYRILTFLSFTLLVALIACEEDEKRPTAPVITIGDEFEDVDGFNVGEKITITVNVKSPLGIRRLAYYFITETDNGTQSGTPVFIDKTDFPQEITEDIVFTVAPGLVEIVIITFDRENNNSEIHITPENIRSVPSIAFKDGVDSRESVFENKVLRVEGTITSEFDLESVTYQTIVDGTTSDATAIPIANPKGAPFSVEVVVPKDLTGIIIKAVNQHDGVAVDTFKIGTVVDDDVNISLEGGKTTIPVAYADIVNTLNGTVFSGSAVVELTYSIKANDAYGAELPLDIGEPNDEFSFSIGFDPEAGIQAIRVTGKNAGGITKVSEFPVEKFYTKLVHFTDITLTSEIGAGKNNWFAAWQEPHVFDITNAAANQLMVDIGLIKYNSTSYRVMPAAVFAENATYKSAMDPYMIGFTKATYTMITANRNAITPEAFDQLEWDGQLMEFLDTKVRAPTAQGGENYNFYTTNRRTNTDLQVGKGFIIGWGQWSPTQNQAFGLVMVKAYSVVDGVATATFEIKVPKEDMRTKYNPVSIFDYTP